VNPEALLTAKGIDFVQHIFRLILLFITFICLVKFDEFLMKGMEKL
jgi:hypothetical protein